MLNLSKHRKFRFHGGWNALILILTLVFTTQCTVKTIVTPTAAARDRTPMPAYEPVAVVETDVPRLEGEVLLAELTIKEAGMSMNCTYEEVLQLAKEQVRALGGNCLVITEHLLPDLRSTCHRIVGSIYYVENAEDYIDIVSWSTERPLQLADFRGDTLQRPFQAATYTTIQSQIVTAARKGGPTVEIKAIFNKDLSYLKRSAADVEVLQHEQLHFDITEIYARQFRKSILENVHTYQDFVSQYKTLFDPIQRAWTLKQDEYDSAVYADSTRQQEWNDWVAAELEKYAAYAAPTFSLRRN